MAEKLPPIDEVVSWASSIWSENSDHDLAVELLAEHIRELFYERKEFWAGILGRIITFQELTMGLSQHIQTWLGNQLKIDEQNVIGVFHSKRQAELLLIIEKSVN